MFSRWRVAQNSKSGHWQVVADGHKVVAECFRESVAAEICREHNSRDPIQSYEDWLFYKGKFTGC